MKRFQIVSLVLVVFMLQVLVANAAGRRRVLLQSRVQSTSHVQVARPSIATSSLYGGGVANNSIRAQQARVPTDPDGKPLIGFDNPPSRIFLRDNWYYYRDNPKDHYRDTATSSQWRGWRNGKWIYGEQRRNAQSIQDDLALRRFLSTNTPKISQSNSGILIGRGGPPPAGAISKR